MAKTTEPVEHVADLTCGQGHTTEVHWTEGQQAAEWQCPECLRAASLEETAAAVADNAANGPDVVAGALREAGQRAHERSLQKFGNRKRGERAFDRAVAHLTSSSR